MTLALFALAELVVLFLAVVVARMTAPSFQLHVEDMIWNLRSPESALRQVRAVVSESTYARPIVLTSSLGGAIIITEHGSTCTKGMEVFHQQLITHCAPFIRGGAVLHSLV